jgi:hypothetical protein
MQYFVGWDVGAWGCRRRSTSQDALAVLKAEGGEPATVGRAWRGNLGATLRQADSLAALINTHCETEIAEGDQITIAIDTPLGLPADTVALFSRQGKVNPTLDSHARNSLIFRQTEIWLTRQSFPPLSALKDMIGSQATKGAYLLCKFGLNVLEGDCGVWIGGNVTAIECYPATCKRSDRKGYLCQGSAKLQAMYFALQTSGLEVGTGDEEDAVYCALVAYLYGCHRNLLVPPQESPPASEGWVWYPKDAIGRRSKKKQKSERSA